MAEAKGNEDNKVYINLDTGKEKALSGEGKNKESGFMPSEWVPVNNWN